MASVHGRIANTVICSACRGPLVPSTKADGGIAFPSELVHGIKPRTKRDTCANYGYPAPATPVPAPLTREERRRIRWVARIAARNTRHEHAAAEAAYDEPTENDVYRHRSKLQPDEDCIDERCFYCSSPFHWSKDCLTI